MLQTFFFLILAHLVADFFLQGPLAVKKRGLNQYMLAHAGIAALAFFVPLTTYPAGTTVTATLILFVAHALQDAAKVEFNRILKLSPTQYLYWASFGLDQMLHVTVIYLLFLRVTGS